MNDDHRPSSTRHLIWVYGDPLGKLDAATWTETSSELGKLGWQVTLVAAGPAEHRSIQGVEVVFIPKPQVYLVRQVLFHLGLLRFLKLQWTAIDVILFHSMAAPWVLPLRLVRRLTRKPRPLLVMDTRTVFMMPRRKERWRDRLRRVFHQFMERLGNRWADGRLAITQHMARAVYIPARKLWGVWPSGVDLGRFAPAQIARRWPKGGEPLRLVYIGVLQYERNLMSLCRAVERANAEGMGFVLSLIGDGMERQDLEQFALQTEGRVRIVPPVPHEQIPRWLAQAHVGVLPFPDEQKFRVSSPIKLFEYMGAGLPILATRIACHTDVIGDGAYAFWAEDASVEGLLAALRLVWQEQDSLGEMGSRAAVAAQAWTWHESAKKLELALERGLAEFAQEEPLDNAP